MQRITELAPAELSPDQREIHDAIVQGPRGKLEGPLPVWLHSPGLCRHAQALGAYCRYGSRLPRRLSELAIIVVAAQWRARYEWHVHAADALRAGLAPAAVEAIRQRAVPVLADDDERAVYAFARELTATGRVSDETFAAAQDRLGAGVVVDLVGIIGYYVMVALTLNTYRVPVPEGATDPFPGAD